MYFVTPASFYFSVLVNISSVCTPTIFHSQEKCLTESHIMNECYSFFYLEMFITRVYRRQKMGRVCVVGLS